MATTTMTVSRSNLVLLLLLSCCSYFFQPVYPFVVQRIAHPQHHRRCHEENIENIRTRSILLAKSNPDDNKLEKKDDDNTDDDDDPVEQFLAMEEASKKTTRRLMFPRMVMTTIGQSITYLTYGFLIFTFALNVAGYSLIKDGKGGVTIGTFEDRDFQMEIVKSMKEK